MRHAIITTLAIAFIVCSHPAYLADPDVLGIWKALSYHFFHANVFHLAANCLSIWFIFAKPSAKTMRQLALAFVIATLAYFTATKPVIGFSNILFAMIGLRTPAFSHPWWRSKNTLIFLGVTLAMLLIPQFSAVTHIVCFAAAVCCASISRYLKSLDDDYRHATGK